MRIVLFLVALAAAGYAGYLKFGTPSLYTSYSPEKLEQLESAYEQKVNFAKGDQLDEDRVSLSLLREERVRREQVKWALGGAGAAFLLALVFTLVGGRGQAREDSRRGEGSGPVAAPGSQVTTREQAAALLGVHPNAPRTVIEAALQAQLAEREPAQLAGLDPTLRDNVLRQREELRQAGNLLLGRQELAFRPDRPQD